MIEQTNIEKFQDDLIRFLIFEEINEEYSSEIELKLFDYLEKDKKVGEWLKKCLKHSKENKNFIVNLLKIFAKITPTKLPHPHSTIAILIFRKDIEIKDSVIKVFESWADKKSFQFLKELPILSPEWLENYKRSVIADISQRLKENN